MLPYQPNFSNLNALRGLAGTPGGGFGANPPMRLPFAPSAGAPPVANPIQPYPVRPISPVSPPVTAGPVYGGPGAPGAGGPMAPYQPAQPGLGMDPGSLQQLLALRQMMQRPMPAMQAY